MSLINTVVKLDLLLHMILKLGIYTFMTSYSHLI